MSVHDYHDLFEELLSVHESYGGRLHDPHTAAPPSYNLAQLPDDAAREAFMRNRYAADLFLMNADPARYGRLRVELANAYVSGREEYPTNLAEAYSRMVHYKMTEQPRRNDGGRGHFNRGGRSGGRSDGGRGDGDRSSGGRNPSDAGHGRGGRSGRNFAQIDFSLAQAQDHFPNGIPDHYVLLDSGSTVSIFCNAAMLTDIHEVDEPLYLKTNGGGEQVSYQMGTVKNLGKVWYNPDSITNILSLSQVCKERRIT